MKKTFKNTNVQVAIVVILFIITFFAISYGAFFTLRTQSDDNVILSGCFSTTFTNESQSISLAKALPMSDEEGIATTPYSITINNTCNMYAKYYVIISSTTGSFSSNYINYQYNSSEVGTLGSAPANTLGTDSGYSDSRIIATGTLANGGSITYNIRLWLNNSVVYSAGSTWSGQIKVISEAAPTYTVTGTSGGNGTVTSSVNISYGGTASLTVTPSSGYYLSSGSCTNGYTITGMNTGSSYTSAQTVTINNSNQKTNSTCTFSFEEKPLVISCETAANSGNYVACDTSSMFIGERVKIGNDANAQYFRYIRTTTSDTSVQLNECGPQGVYYYSDCADTDNGIVGIPGYGYVRLLAEYNLVKTESTIVSTALQDTTTAANTVAYDSTSVVYNRPSAMKGYIDNYANLLSTTYGISGLSGSAITKAEVFYLCNVNGYGQTCANTYPWVYQTPYWTGSSLDPNGNIWTVTSGLAYYGNYKSTYYGVRPVIQILASSL